MAFALGVTVYLPLLVVTPSISKRIATSVFSLIKSVSITVLVAVVAFFVSSVLTLVMASVYSRTFSAESTVATDVGAAAVCATGLTTEGFGLVCVAPPTTSAAWAAPAACVAVVATVGVVVD